MRKIALLRLVSKSIVNNNNLTLINSHFGAKQYTELILVRKSIVNLFPLPRFAH